MATHSERLAVLQEVDLKILKLQKELSDIPARKKQAESAVDQKKLGLKTAKDAAAQKQAEAKKLDLEIESHREKIRKLREQQLQLKSNKEFKAMDDEIKAAEQAIRSVEDSELRILEEIETAGRAVAAAKQEFDKQEAVVRDEAAVLDKRSVEIEAEIALLATDRAAKAADVDPGWLRRYESLFKNRKDRVLVRVEHGVCGGCNMTLAPHIVHDAKRGDLIVSCSFCGKMLC